MGKPAFESKVTQENRLQALRSFSVHLNTIVILSYIPAPPPDWRKRFYTVTELALKLTGACKNGTLERLLKELRTLDFLILDEWGYVPVDKDGSQLLFRVISDSYESKSLILTTNLEFSKWGGIFTDDQMAAAMIDCVVHHGHLLIFEGRSYRMEHA